MVGLVEIDEYIAYASAVGVDLTSEAISDLTAQLNTAIRFIDSVDSKLRGKRTEQTQPHSYPRKNLQIYGEDWPKDVIPQQAKDCQMAFALEVRAGIDIFGAKTNLPVIKEQVGEISVQYASPKESTAEERESLAMFLLRELMDIETPKGGAGQLTLTRR